MEERDALIKRLLQEIEELKAEVVALRKENAELRKENTELKEEIKRLKGTNSGNSSKPPLKTEKIVITHPITCDLFCPWLLTSCIAILLTG